jgi:hypothetical protein
MSAAGPKPQPDQNRHERHPVPEVYTLETTGLLLIAALILILTLIRYWHSIAWSAH